MNPHPMEVSSEPAPALAHIDHIDHSDRIDDTVRLPLALSARMANIMFTAQVQVAYAYANDARQSAERAITNLEGSWPATPVRELLLNAYRAQAQSAEAMARNLLAGARRRCGLAYAQY